MNVSHRSWLRAALAVLLCALTVCGGAVYLLDPCLYYRLPERAVYFDERLQNPGIIRNCPAETVLLGTSMAANYHKSQIEELWGGTALRITVPGAYLSELDETVDLLFAHTPGLMIQEFLNGQEFGADCYIDLISGELVSVFTKKKLLMRAGETDKAVSYKDPALFELLDRFIGESGWRGQIDIDIFRVDGEYYISEVNPRFGGGYPHAYESGCDHMKLILRNLQGLRNERQIGAYETGIIMMKYNEVMIRKETEA